MFAPRKTVCLRTALILATLFAMIVAPLCGPLCAAGACARALHPATSCHEETAASNSDGPEFGIAAVKACNLNELPAAKLTELSSLTSGKVRVLLLGLNPHPDISALPGHGASSDFFAPAGPPLSSSDKGAPAVLRI